MSQRFSTNRGLARGRAMAEGFSLVELLVSLGIMTVILSVIVLNQSSYSEAAALGNLADEIASTVSQAQAYGIAVKERSPGSADFSSSYGLSLSLLDSGSQTSYIFFADRNGNESYDGDWSCGTGGTSECLDKTDILRGNYLDSICVIRSSGGDQCGGAKRVDLSFLRPNVEARLIFFNNGGQNYNPPNMLGVKFVLKSSSGLVRSVSVYESGQVSVQ